MNQDRVAWLHARRKRIEVVGVRRAGEIRGEQSGECRLLLLSVISGRIDVIYLSAGRGLRFETRANGDDVFRLSVNAIGIGHHKPALVIGRGFEIENASGKSIRRDVLKSVLVVAFVTDLAKRQAFFAGLL